MCDRFNALPIFTGRPVSYHKPTNLDDILERIHNILLDADPWETLTQILWVSSHMTPAQFCIFPNWKDYIGNGVVDKFAGYAANANQIDPAVARRVHQIDSNVPFVIERIAAIDMLVTQKINQHDRSSKMQNTKGSGLDIVHEHAWHKWGRSIRCNHCTIVVKPSRLSQATKRPCIDFARHPMWQQHSYLAVVHSSHTVSNKAGVALCLHCGAWTTGSSRLLAEPCDLHGLTSARHNGKNRFLRGLHPCKPTTLAQDMVDRQGRLKLVLDKIDQPVLRVKRVVQAIDLASKPAKKPRKTIPDHSTVIPDDSAIVEEHAIPNQEPPQNPFDDPDGDPWFEEDRCDEHTLLEQVPPKNQFDDSDGDSWFQEDEFMQDVQHNQQDSSSSGAPCVVRP